MMSNTHKKGFTLIEIIVSLAVFMIVAMVALSALVKIISANKKAQTLQSSITDLNFALETMSRELRVGSIYKCYFGSEVSGAWSFESTISPESKSCDFDSDDSDKILAFVSSYPAKDSSGGACSPTPHNKAYAYKFVKNTTDGTWDLQKAQESGCGGIGDGDFKSIISKGVNLTSYNLGVKYEEPDAYMPYVFIKLSGYAGIKEKEKSYFDIQTAVVSRFP